MKVTVINGTLLEKQPSSRPSEQAVVPELPVQVDEEVHTEFGDLGKLLTS